MQYADQLQRSIIWLPIITYTCIFVVITRLKYQLMCFNLREWFISEIFNQTKVLVGKTLF